MAEQAYKTALRLDPADRDAWYFLGRCYSDQGASPTSRSRALNRESARRGPR
ncbi:MAG: hypothetical protein ACREEM_53700, partial [Blastocatellia bacterium]